MSFLMDFINVLNEEELRKVKQMPVLGKEYEVLELFVKAQRKKEPSNLTITRQLGISNTHCDKIKSVLLEKIYRHLSPGDSLAVLEMLYRKRAVPHLLLREIKAQEKELLRSHPPRNILHRFYDRAFLYSVNVNYKDVDMAFSKKLGERMLLYSANKDYDRFMLDAKFLWLYITGHGINATVEQPKVVADIEKRIAALIPVAEKLNNPHVFYEVNLKYILLYNLTNRGEDALRYVKKNIELVQKHTGTFEESTIKLTNLKYAETLYMASRFNEAAAYYRKIFERYDDEVRSDIYSLAKFSQVLTITKQFEECEKLLNETTAIFSAAENYSPRVMTAMCYAKLYLCQRQLDKAYAFILLARQHLRKNVYIQYEIELRNLENAYFYLCGDCDFAVSLARKNLKFLSSKNMGPGKADFSYFYQLIIAFYQQRAKAKPLSEEHRHMLAHCHTGSWGVYGLLLDLISTV